MAREFQVSGRQGVDRDAEFRKATAAPITISDALDSRIKEAAPINRRSGAVRRPKNLKVHLDRLEIHVRSIPGNKPLLHVTKADIGKLWDAVTEGRTAVTKKSKRRGVRKARGRKRYRYMTPAKQPPGLPARFKSPLQPVTTHNLETGEISRLLYTSENWKSLKQNQRSMQTNVRPQLFISYAHADRELVGHFQTHIASLVHERVLSLWIDQILTVGDAWREGIGKALEETDGMIFFISAHSLASDFINTVELARAREAHKQGTYLLFPIVLRPTYFAHSWLSEIQVSPAPDRPVVSYNDVDVAYMEIMGKIHRRVEEWRRQDVHQ